MAIRVVPTTRRRIEKNEVVGCEEDVVVNCLSLLKNATIFGDVTSWNLFVRASCVLAIPTESCNKNAFGLPFVRRFSIESCTKTAFRLSFRRHFGESDRVVHEKCIWSALRTSIFDRVVHENCISSV